MNHFLDLPILDSAFRNQLIVSCSYLGLRKEVEVNKFLFGFILKDKAEEEHTHLRFTVYFWESVDKDSDSFLCISYIGYHRSIIDNCLYNTIVHIKFQVNKKIGKKVSLFGVVSNFSPPITKVECMIKTQFFEFELSCG